MKEQASTIQNPWKTVLGARGLYFSVGGKTLLEDIDFSLAEGKLLAIVGPSGAGKSTLLKCLSGIKRPSVGQAFLAGKPAHQQKRSPSLFGYVPQDDIIHLGLSVQKVLTYAAELRLANRPTPARRARVEEVMELLGLDERRDLRVRRLSGGQRKRVSIGVELLAQPKVMLLDEPTSGLDPALEKQLMALLSEIAKDGRCVALTTHVMESMSAVDALMVLYQGHLAYYGPPQRALSFFRVDKLQDVFDQLKKRPPNAWNGAFKREVLA
jgi:ABC-type multidrug transport system ATPase subunit